MYGMYGALEDYESSLTSAYSKSTRNAGGRDSTKCPKCGKYKPMNWDLCYLCGEKVTSAQRRKKVKTYDEHI